MSRRSGRRARTRWPAFLAPLALFGLLAVTAVLGWRLLQDPVRWPVRTIGVDGDFRHLDRTELQRVLAAAVEGGFFGVDLERVRAAALELPWVAGVEVARVWPDRLEVKVEEQLPVARFNDDALVNRRGEVFRPRDGGRPTLPLRFRGPEGKAAQMLAFYRRVAPAFRARGLRIREVRLDRRGEWRLQLADGPLVVVGREGEDFRVSRLLRVYPVLAAAGRPVRRIDLRYDQGFAVAWGKKKG